MTAKQTATDRRAQILSAAVKLAAKYGYMNVTRDQLAQACALSTGSINKYFSTMPQLKRDVIRFVAHTAQPTDRDALTVLAQGLALKDRHALKAPESLRKAALATL